MTTLLTAPEEIFTVEEFKRLPLEGQRWELLDGAVVKMEPHDLAATTSLTGAIVQYARKTNFGETFAAGCGFRCWLGHETVRVTDVSFSRRDTIPLDRHGQDYPRWAPDLIVEVLSLFEQFHTSLARIAMFLQSGTELVWIVDPGKRTITVVQAGESIGVPRESDTLDGGVLMPEFLLPVSDVFL